MFLGVCGCLLVSEGAYWNLRISTGAYLRLTVPNGVCGCLRVSTGT